MSYLHRLICGLVCLTFSLLSTGGYAREEGINRINSLQQKLLELKKNDSNKVNVLTDLAYEYNRVSPYDGVRIGMQALELASNLDWPRGMARANSSLGANYFSMSEYTNAYKYWIAALNINETIGNKQGVANHLHNIGNIFLKQKEYTEALSYYRKALKSNTEIDNKSIITYSYTAIGDVYFFLRKYDSAIDYHYKAYAIDTALGKKANIAADLLNIGAVYNEQGEYGRAMTALNSALLLKKEVGEKNGIAKSYNKIGTTYLHIGMLATKSKDGVAAFGSDQKNYSLARTYFDSAVLIGREIGYLDILQQSYEQLAQVNELLGNSALALSNYKNFIGVRDSVYSAEKHREIFNLEKKVEITMRTREEERAQERAERMKYIEVGGVCTFIALSVLVILILRKKRVSPKVLEVLGAFSVLIIFEFVQLLLHEQIASITHHNFMFTLICLMVLASIIIPVHHKVLHWMKEHLGKKPGH